MTRNIDSPAATIIGRRGAVSGLRAALIGVLVGSVAVLSTPAAAHPGGHDHMSWAELVRHYAEPDHLAFLVLAAIVGWLAFRWGRRVEAQAQAHKRERSDGVSDRRDGSAR
jgi:hypothetical protein